MSYDEHTGFVMPASEIQARLPDLKARFRSAPYLEFGWGDKAFYQAVQKTTDMSLPAMFWPTDSAIQVIATPDMSAQYFQTVEVRKICLNNSEYLSLVSFISNSFEKGSDGNIIQLKRGQYQDGQFYSAVGNYSLVNTCNSWTAKGLKSSGIDISPTFKLTASSVMDYLQELKNREETTLPKPPQSMPGLRCPGP